MNNKRLTERQQYWLSHIQACQQQRISMKDYAQQQGIALHALYDAKCRLNKIGVLSSKPKSKFQKAEITRVASTLCIIHLPNGIRLEWPTDNSTQTLTAILSAAIQLG